MYFVRIRVGRVRSQFYGTSARRHHVYWLAYQKSGDCQKGRLRRSEH